MATQIAHHSSRISVGSIITVARKQGLRTTIGLRPDEALALEADTYMARARLRNGRGPNPGPWRHGSAGPLRAGPAGADRKSTRLNSSHPSISYAVFCLKKKKKKTPRLHTKKKKKTHIDKR